MAFVHKQGVLGTDGATGASQSVTITAAPAGSLICGVGSFDNATFSLQNVQDNAGNTYNTQVVADNTNQQSIVLFWLGNINNAPTSVTLNLTGNSTSIRIGVDVYTGAAALADPSDGHTGQVLTPSTGADAATSGTFADTADGNMIYGVIGMTGGGSTMTNGTNFAVRNQGLGTDGVPISTEDRIVQNTHSASTVATWTLGTSAACGVLGIAFKALVSSSTQDFPNPQPPRPSVDLKSYLFPGGQRLFVKTDKQFAGPGQWKAYDWPNPIGWDVRSRGQPGAWLRSYTFPGGQNLLKGKDTQFAGPGQWTTYDWPNPRGYIPGITLKTWTDPTKIWLIGKDRFFGLAGAPNFDWPNPRGYVPSIDLRTFLNSAEIQLIGKDKFFGLAGNPNFNWPNPGLPRRVIDLLTWLQSSTTILTSTTAPFNLDDWPNPRGAARLVDYSLYDSGNALGSGQDQFFGLAGNPNFDWPNPGLPRRVIDLLTWLQSSTTVLTSTVAPFNLDDWPNPRGYARLSDYSLYDSGNALGSGQDQFFGLAGNPNFDWPNPQQPRRSVDLLTWVQEGNDTVELGVPFFQTDWPVPKVALPSTSLKTWTDPTKIWFGSDQFFGLAGNPNFDWPVPKGAVPGISLKTWTDPTKIWLIGKDQFFGLAGNPNFDWPNPQQPRRSVDLLTWIQEGNDTVELGSPFVQSDWPNPIPPRAAIDLRSVPPVATIRLAGQDKLPGRNFDYPNPQQPRRVVDLLTWLQEGNDTVELGSPFTQTDWPNPRGATPSTSLKTWTDPTKIQLIGKDQFFGLAGHPNFDWPVPKGAQPGVTLKTWTDPTKIQLVGQDKLPNRNFDQPNPILARRVVDLLTWIQEANETIELGGPFKQTDWPNPRGPNRVVDLLTWIQEASETIELGAPFSQQDWPNPRGPNRPVDLLSWAQPGNSAAAASTPFASLDWPNPRSPRFAIELLTWIQEANEAIEVGAPFFNADWTNPQGKRFPTELLTWIQEAAETIELGMPFVNNSWPNPQRARPATELLTWIQRINEQALAVLPQVPNVDWRNPRGPRFPFELLSWLQQGNANLPIPPITTVSDWNYFFQFKNRYEARTNPIVGRYFQPGSTLLPQVVNMVDTSNLSYQPDYWFFLAFSNSKINTAFTSMPEFRLLVDVRKLATFNGSVVETVLSDHLLRHLQVVGVYSSSVYPYNGLRRTPIYNAE